MAKAEELKRKNMQAVRRCFYSGGEWTKASLARQTGISLAGITNFLKEMMAEEEILRAGEDASTGGRRSVKYVLNPRVHHSLCLSLSTEGGLCVLDARVLDAEGKELAHSRMAKRDAGKQDLQGVLEKEKRDDPSLDLCVLSVPGVCARGKVYECDWKALEGSCLAACLEKAGVSVEMENDTNLAVVGLSRRCRNVRNMALVYLPREQCAGCGILIQGKLYRGSTGRAGELRYLPEDTLWRREEREVCLEKEIQSLCAVLDPELVAWCSQEEGLNFRPDELSLPERMKQKLIRIDNLPDLIEEGMREICRAHYTEG